MQSSEKTWTLCAIIVGGLLTAMLYHSFLTWGLGVGYPGNTFLFNPEIRFSDFYWIFEPVQAGNPLGGQMSVYFPFAYVPLFPFAGLPWPVAFTAIVLIFAVSVWCFFWGYLDFLFGWKRPAAAFIIPLLSYPVLICIDRGNIELIVIIFTIGFFVLFARGQYLLSSLPLAAAIAMKIYPGAFGVLLLLRKQYAAAALTAVLTLVLSLGAAASFPGGLSETLELMRHRLEFFDSMYISSPNQHQGSLSYLSLIKIASRATGYDYPAYSEQILLVYNIVTGALFGAVVLYILFRERALWKQVYLIAFLTLVIPHVSFDYKAMILLLPVALFLGTPAEGRRTDMLYLMLLGLLLIPKAYFPVYSETKISGLINPFVLTFLAVHIIWTGLRRRRADAEVQPSHEQVAATATLARIRC